MDNFFRPSPLLENTRPKFEIQKTPVRRPFLYLIAFTAGFVSLGVELSASRLLDPWFGNSILVWASLIALILLYLSVGYWLGGRVADRHPQARVLLTLTGMAAFLVGLTPVFARPILRMTAGVFQVFDAAILLGAFVAVLLLFAAPVILLGMVSPFIIRLLVAGSEDAGRVSGNVYALSTAGSILGVFAPVLLLIPNIGTRRTFIVLGMLLLGLSALGLARIARWRALALGVAWGALAALLLWPSAPIHVEPDTVYEQESLYNYIRVVRNGPEMLLKLNEGAGVHSVYRPDMLLADGIWDAFLIAPYFAPAPVHPEDVKRMLIIGLAGGTVAKLASLAYGPIPIDGVELDPAIIETGRRYFDMTESNLRPVAQDGRYFLNHGAGRYDLIVIDAYRPPYIPFHLTTVEFFAEVDAHLTPNGVVAINIGRTADDYALVDALAATMAQVFPSVFVLDEVDSGEGLGNSLVVATRRPASLDDFRANTAALPEPILAEVARRYAPHARLAPSDGPILTDDKSPIEQIVHGVIMRYLAAMSN